MSTHNPRKRVVVTGMGTTNPVGGDVATTWEALVKGQSGVQHIEAPWVEDLPVKIAGVAAVEPTEVLERVKARRLDRTSQFAMVAAMEAWQDSGLADADLDKDRLGVAMASGIGGLITTLENYDALKEKGPRRVSPLAVPMLMPNAPAANISLYVGARAAVNTPVSACASGNEAISLALDQIRLGRADVVLAGGTEAAITSLPMAAFGNMMALSKNTGDPTTVSRPWDVKRDGFVLGEGAGVLVLESEEHALARGARIYATVLGAGITADAHDIAQPDPAGRGGARAIVRALQESDIEPSDIVHINAHATSTPQGDIAEGLMIHATLGSHADRVVVTSTKSMTGHLLGGAGALEAIATVLAIRERVSPPTINLDDKDPQVELDIPTTARDLPSGDIAALNNSFGFGGANVAVAFGSVCMYPTTFRSSVHHLEGTPR
jgi:3-oxoacyl-[acyl-carrier-protein] synthase II